ncbi:hypothetical protein CERSUDRAFT_100571 [Gelatoporia subvermispora B]|uniref:Uncharacterized protein n=1 Tax=Ceriporiopsis subvermispora (strain B) TaxID=914234 RepID=M2QXG1_CERS8|nr:hypothetical protein CERSUDRAFT_100571 [Gelatoporia subvermispora B]
MANASDIGVIARLELPPLDSTLGAMVIGSPERSGAFRWHNFMDISVAITTGGFFNALSLTLQVFVGSFNIIIVQCFLIWRVWMLSGRRLEYIIPLIILALAQFGSGIAYYVKSCDAHYLSYAPHTDPRVASSSYLSPMSLNWRRVDTIGCRFDVLTFAIVIKLYTNSFLMTLNVRDKLQGSLSDIVPLDGLAFVHGNNPVAPTQQLTIHVTSDITVDISPSDPDDIHATDTSSYELHLFETKDKGNIFKEQPHGSAV